MGNGYEGKHVKNNPHTSNGKRVVALGLAAYIFISGAWAALNGVTNDDSTLVEQPSIYQVLDENRLSALLSFKTPYDEIVSSIYQSTPSASKTEILPTQTELIYQSVLDELKALGMNSPKDKLDLINIFMNPNDEHYEYFKKAIMNLEKETESKIYNRLNVIDGIYTEPNTNTTIMQTSSTVTITQEDIDEMQSKIWPLLQNEDFQKKVKIILDNQENATLPPIVFISMLIDGYGNGRTNNVMELPEKWIEYNQIRSDKLAVNPEKTEKIAPICSKCLNSAEENIKATMKLISDCQSFNAGSSVEDLRTVLIKLYNSSEVKYEKTSEKVERILKTLVFLNGGNELMFTAKYYRIVDRDIVDTYNRIYTVSSSTYDKDKEYDDIMESLKGKSSRFIMNYYYEDNEVTIRRGH